MYGNWKHLAPFLSLDSNFKNRHKNKIRKRIVDKKADAYNDLIVSKDSNPASFSSRPNHA
jgi:hypothetical protein